MIQITIKNYRAIERAKLTIDGVALVAGRNEAGKSSIAQAVRAVLAQTDVPVPGMLKKDVSGLIREGESVSEVHLKSEDGEASLVINKKASIQIDGEAAPCSDIAVGFRSFLGMDAKERALYLSSQVLGSGLAGVQVQDFYAAMDDIGYGEKAAAKVWEEIKQGDSGWDACHKRARDYVTRQKGAWEEVTGERWGVRKGENWPEEKRDITDTLDQLQERKKKIEDRIRGAMVAQEIAGVNKEQLREQVAQIPQLEAKLRELEADAASKRAAWNKANQKQIPIPHDPGEPLSCPECGSVLAISEDKGRKFLIGSRAVERPSAEAIEAAMLEANKHRAHVDDLLEELNTAIEARNEVERKLRGRRAAAEDLKAMQNAPATTEDIDALKAELEQLTQDLIYVQSVDRAAAIHSDIVRNDELTKLLAPEGLRRQKLGEALASINEQCAMACGKAKWPTVVIRDDLSVMYGTRPIELASASGVFRADVVLQIVLGAAQDGSRAVVIDAADILDARGRNGLFGLLKDTGTQALVCMTLNKPELAPDLKAAGMGNSYWIEGGTLTAIGQQQEAA